MRAPRVRPRRVLLAAALLSALGTSPALAEPGALVPAAREQGSLAVELGADGLWAKACAEAPCQARAGVRFELPAEAAQRRAAAALEVLDLEQQRRVLHVRVPLGTGQWEALLAARPGRLEPVLIWAGVTGVMSGVEGEQRGLALQILARSGGRRVLVGETREDINLCGRTTLLAPRLLVAGGLALEPASIQRLGADERRHALELVAAREAPAPPSAANAAEASAVSSDRPAPAPKPANPLRARAASSALGSVVSLTDGDPNTRWSEARAGDGRGEFVVLQNSAERPLIAFELLVRALGAAAEGGAAPRELWLATRGALYHVRFKENAWGFPGAWYRVDLPAPVQTDCVALVLESSYAGTPAAEVGLAELVARVAPLQLDPELAASRLSLPGADGDAALGAVLSAADAGIAATLAALPVLDAVGQRRALEVLERAPCGQVSAAYTRYLTPPSAESERAERRLRQCGRAAGEAMAQAFERGSNTDRPALARLLAALAPAQSIPLLATALATAQRPERDVYRDALSAARRRPEAEPELRRLLADATLSPRVTLELLRVLDDDVARYQPDASAALDRVARVLPSFPERYLALAPAGRLSSQAPSALALMLAALRDPDPHLRAEALRWAPARPDTTVLVLAASRDPNVRVRAAAAARLGELRLGGATSAALVERLHEDPWPLVRVAAASALSQLGTDPSLDPALAQALRDKAPSVRVAALSALGARRAYALADVVAARFHDHEETPAVRAAAAKALGELCVQSARDELTQIALWLAEPGRPDAELGLARSSLAALGRLAPPDIERRLARLSQAKISPVLRPVLEAALHPSESCAGKAAPDQTTR